MRRVAMILALAVVLAMAAAGVALAEIKTCVSVPCQGTNFDDLLYERVGGEPDRIFGSKGTDVIDANTFNVDRDRLFGGPHGDRLLTNDGDKSDLADGGKGRDVCYVDREDEAKNCERVRRATFEGNSPLAQDKPASAFTGLR